MRRVAVGAMLAVLFSAPAFAALTDVDTDMDGFATFDELVVAYPTLTEAVFEEIDLNDDGMIDEAELTAAVDAELLVAEPSN